MAKDSQRLEQEFIATVRDKTGKDLSEWMRVIQTSNLDKPSAILKWLKEQHGLNHLQANFLAGIYLNDGQPVYDYEALFAKLFEDRDALLPLYKALEKAIQSKLPDAAFIPTKAYVSIEDKKCFACATLTKQSIRVGLDLGELPYDEYLQKAKSLGAMPNITHMVEINALTQVSDRLTSYVEQAYKRNHK